MSERLAVGLAVLVLSGLVVVPAAGASTARSGSLGGAVAVQNNFEHTTFVITVYENGSARWTFRYTQPLENESQEQNFKVFAQDFNENETELYRSFKSRAEQLTAAGTNATGRQMEAKAFSKHAEVAVTPSGDQGVVEMSFLWTNFAQAQGETVTVGDVFEGGLYLGPNQRLRIEHGPSMEFSNVEPQPDSDTGDTITWTGERQFNNNKPHVELNPPGSGNPEGNGSGVPTMVAIALVLLLGVGAVVAWRSGAFGDGDERANVPADDGGQPTPTPADADGGVGSPGGGVAGEPAVPDEELLSDEDRVLHLLEDNGGRMKQVNIVEETGWSKSKVSMLLSDMEEEDKISKLRVGRENVISLKGHEPDAARSPFDEDEG